MPSLIALSQARRASRLLSSPSRRGLAFQARSKMSCCPLDVDLLSFFLSFFLSRLKLLRETVSLSVGHDRCFCLSIRQRSRCAASASFNARMICSGVNPAASRSDIRMGMGHVHKREREAARRLVCCGRRGGHPINARCFERYAGLGRTATTNPVIPRNSQADDGRAAAGGGCSRAAALLPNPFAAGAAGQINFSSASSFEST